MTSEPAAAEEHGVTARDLHDIQGNLAGFNKDHQHLVYLGFNSQEIARALLDELHPIVSSAYEVQAFNHLFREIRGRQGGDPADGIIEATWLNVGLTFHGLQALGVDGLDQLPPEFVGGMTAAAGPNGDVDDSSPAKWIPPFQQEIDALVILAADTEVDLDRAYARLQAVLSNIGVAELGTQRGDVRPDPNSGHEHFGFRDGISQPVIVGLASDKPKQGSDKIALGEFVIGHPDESGIESGSAVPAPPGTPGYPNTPGTPGLPGWAHNGSFLVYRRLRQNVGAFSQFLADQAPAIGVSEDLLGAKFVGRWKSGAPLERVRHVPEAEDPADTDPSVAAPSILNDHHVNAFVYDPDDADGHRVPRAAHIRKTNPRNQQPPGSDEVRRHRILRRGIPYGLDFVPGEPPYPGAAAPPDDQDRGLLFVCYQASIARGFEFIQRSWANQPDFPQGADGRDPIISQDVPSRDFNLTPQNEHLQLARWVTTTGGEYFFSPSISALKNWARSG